MDSSWDLIGLLGSLIRFDSVRNNNKKWNQSQTQYLQFKFKEYATSDERIVKQTQNKSVTNSK
jgi:hypothetical protein